MSKIVGGAASATSKKSPPSMEEGLFGENLKVLKRLSLCCRQSF